jgi:hypothetical protein
MLDKETEDAIKRDAVYDDDKDYDFVDSVIYDSKLLDTLELVVREFAKTGYCREYFMTVVTKIADDEKLFRKRSIENIFKELDKLK